MQNSAPDEHQAKTAKMNGFGSGKAARKASFDLSDSTKLLAAFRVNLKTLSRKKEYQILRIEAHGDSLTYQEKQQRRIVISLRMV